jgi:hypothetical protein
MVEHAALLVDEILPEAPYRQWVLSVPFQLRFLFASKPEVMSKALGIVYRTIATHMVLAAGQTHDTAHTGAITFIQRFGSALNLNVHFHMLFLDGVYVGNKANKLKTTVSGKSAKSMALACTPPYLLKRTSAKAGSHLPLHSPPSNPRATTGADQKRQRALRAEDAVPGWHHACDIRSTGP